MFRLVLCALVALGGLIASAPAARAAELRITFDELTRLVESIVANAQVYLNNAPGGFLSSQSYIAIAPGQQYPLPVPVNSFQIAGSTYGYYVKDISSTSLRAASVSGALRLTMAFETEGPEAVAGCISGECQFADVLPNIEWTAPVVNIDFVPVHFNGSISLQVKDVKIGGVPRAVCKTSVDIFAKAACRLGLPAANSMVSRLKADLPRTLKDQINQANIQQQFADGLKKHLTLGQAGAVAISKISIAPKSVTFDFRFSAAGANGN